MRASWSTSLVLADAVRIHAGSSLFYVVHVAELLPTGLGVYFNRKRCILRDARCAQGAEGRREPATSNRRVVEGRLCVRVSVCVPPIFW